VDDGVVTAVRIDRFGEPARFGDAGEIADDNRFGLRQRPPRGR